MFACRFPHGRYALLFAGALVHLPQLSLLCSFLKNPILHFSHMRDTAPDGRSDPARQFLHSLGSVLLPSHVLLGSLPLSHAFAAVTPGQVWHCRTALEQLMYWFCPQ